MPKRVAVITDANSSGHWFPKWHRYYAGQFGEAALYVVTYQGHTKEFLEYRLGGLSTLPSAYSDDRRPKIISSLVAALLKSYDVVVRCDVDEFLIPDLRRFSGLDDYIERLTLPYVTAKGVEVFAETGAAPLDMQAPVLGAQRSYAVMATALHKTAITTVPLRWGAGFHGATAPPVFDDLYLFHLKLADMVGRREWCQVMQSRAAPGSREFDYFSNALESLVELQESFSEKQSADAWTELTSTADLEKYRLTVQTSPEGIQHGAFDSSGPKFVVPHEFSLVV